MTLLRMLAFRPDAAAARDAGVSAPTTVPAARAASTVAAAPNPAAAVPTSIDAGNWAALVDAAGLSGMVRQFALNCVPAAFDGQLLRLQLDPSVAERRTRQIDEKLVQALSGYFGKEIRVVLETAESPLITPARQRALADKDRAQRAASAFEEDAAVKGLRERFGGEVDAGSVKPTN